MALLSGGRGIAGRQILHEITGWVKDVVPALGIEAQPQPPLPNLTAIGYPLFDSGYPYSNPMPLSFQPNVPFTQVHIGGLGTLHDDPNWPPANPWMDPPQRGSLYCVTPAGAGPVDATPSVHAASVLHLAVV